MALGARGDDDETFFFRASQVAAQRRKERLEEGRDSLAVELSSASGAATAVKEEEEEGKAMEGDAEGASAIGEGTEKNETKESQSASNDIKVPVDPFQLRQQQQDTAAKPRGGDDFQRKLLETRLLMEENAKLARKVKELEERNEGVAETISPAAMGEADQTVEDQAAEEESAPVGSAVSEPITLDDYAALLSGIETKEEEEDEEKSPQESSTAQSGPRLSSDGKELFEPSPEALAIDREKVDVGLLTLTRGLLALQSIVNKEDS